MTFFSSRIKLSLDFLLIVFVLSVTAHLASGFYYGADFGVWKSDGEIFAKCIADVNGGHCRGLSKFSVAYLLNSLLHSGSEIRLALLNGAALLLPVICLGLMGDWRLMLRGGSIYLLAVAVSPLPGFYLNSGALEIQAGVISGIFMACLSRLMFNKTESAPPTQLLVVMLVSGVLLPLYKDTIVLVLVIAVCVLGVGNAYLGRSAKMPSLTRLKLVVLYAAIPLLVGVMISVAYNILRYDALIPVAYIHEAAQTTPEFLKSAEFFFGSIMSPNGGVVIFWALPLTVALLGWRMRGFHIEPNAITLAILVAFVSCIVFGRWWAPFGWDSWGNRLMIQPMLAVLVASLLSLQPISSQSGRSLKSIALLFALPVLLASAYYIFVPYFDGRGKSIQRSLWAGPACTQMGHRLQTDAPAMGLSFWRTADYYRCARERMLYVPYLTQ